MIKIVLLCLCLYGVALGSPVPGSFATIDDVENEAEIVDALEPLPGNRNLNEKRVPVIRLTIPAGYLGQLYGTKNLAERKQLPFYDTDHMLLLPGVRNLEEKAIPDAVIARMSAGEDPYYSARHPKSEVEKVVV
ncbi:uncharacterized protein LOC100120963 [Nasonia vitripennis]|uniref:Uncharacterized protein n=1 Tax=Nasonia vitripennis TaxID=7425 RepID=A0A7M7LM21_NASVI|nr:uncharacterized protein LOC100120963 [Nasonia vitripennis]